MSAGGDTTFPASLAGPSSTLPAGARTVVLVRNEQEGYGFSIRGGDNPGEHRTPIIISKLKPDGPAAQSQKLHVGDQILSINGMSLGNATHERAVLLLKQSTGQLKLVVRATGVDLHSAGTGSNAYLPGRHNSASRLFLAAIDYERVQILYNYRPSADDELELNRGDIVLVKGKGTDGWCLGECQRTGKSGYFPGNFAMKIRHTKEELDSIYAEVDRRNTPSPMPPRPGGGEGLYESLPGEEQPTSPTPQSPLSPPAIGLEPLYERVQRQRAESGTAAFVVADENEETSPQNSGPVYSLAQGSESKANGGAAANGFSGTSTLRPGPAPFQVKLIGVVGERGLAPQPPGAKAAGGADSAPPADAGDEPGPDSGDASGSTSPAIGEIIYAPLNPTGDKDGSSSGGNSGSGGGKAGEVIYAPIIGKRNHNSSDVSRAPSFSGDIYASVSKPEDAGEEAPAVPKRGYDKNLLSPTIHIHMSSPSPTATDSTYEVLPAIYEPKETTDTGECETSSLLYEHLPASDEPAKVSPYSFTQRKSQRSIGGSDVAPSLPTGPPPSLPSTASLQGVAKSQKDKSKKDKKEKEKQEKRDRKSQKDKAKKKGGDEAAAAENGAAGAEPSPKDAKAAKKEEKRRAKQEEKNAKAEAKRLAKEEKQRAKEEKARAKEEKRAKK